MFKALNLFVIFLKWGTISWRQPAKYFKKSKFYGYMVNYVVKTSSFLSFCSRGLNTCMTTVLFTWTSNLKISLYQTMSVNWEILALCLTFLRLGKIFCSAFYVSLLGDLMLLDVNFYLFHLFNRVSFHVGNFIPFLIFLE